MPQALKRSPGAAIRDFFTNLGRLSTEALAVLEPEDQGDPAVPETSEPPRETVAERAMDLGTVFEQVYTQAWEKADQGSNCYLVSIYIEEGNLYALMTEAGKLYRSPVLIDGSTATLGEGKEPVMVEYTAAPEAAEGEAVANAVPTERTKIMRVKDDQGRERVRWFSQSCTSVINRVGQIDSTRLFDSFIAHAKRTGEYPIRQFFHAGEAYRTGQTDWLGRDGFVYLTSGLFDIDEATGQLTTLAAAEVAAREANPDYWGESIGFDVTAPPVMLEVAGGIQIPMYVEGIHRETSCLPEHMAAALFTRTNQEVTRMLNQVQMQELVRLFGGDEAAAKAWLEANPDATNRAIQSGQLIARTQPAIDAAAAAAVAEASQDQGEDQADDEEVTEEAAGQERASEDLEADDESDLDEDGQDQGPEIELDEPAIQAISEHVLASPQMTQMFQRIEQMAESQRLMSETATGVHTRLEQSIEILDERVEALSQDDHERAERYRADMPRRRPQAVTYRAREVRGEDEPRPMSEMADETLANL